MDDELKTNLDRMKKTVMYIDILEKHGFFEDPNCFSNRLSHTLESCLAMFDRIDKINYADVQREGTTLEMYDNLKVLANICLFVDAIEPVVSKYNPTDDDKKRFLEFIGYKEDKDE